MKQAFFEALDALSKLLVLAKERAEKTGTEQDRVVVARYEQAMRLLLADSHNISGDEWDAGPADCVCAVPSKPPREHAGACPVYQRWALVHAKPGDRITIKTIRKGHA